MSRHERVVIIALASVALALLLVGIVSGTILRHAVQVTPVLAACGVGLLRLRWSGFAAMAVFIFWLGIMLLIWLYLLGVANIVSGRFSATEIGLTIIIGLGCVIGLAAWAHVRGPSRVAWPQALAAFAIFAALQVGAMWLSLQPALEHR